MRLCAASKLRKSFARIGARRMTLREEAKQLGLDFGEWSRIEYGREPETEAGRAAWEQRLREIGDCSDVLPPTL